MLSAIKQFIWGLRTRNMCKCNPPLYEVIDGTLYCKQCRKPVSSFEKESE